MLREGTPIGLINIRRTEVRPFSDRHIRLLETFADQAVIAIENVRLFKELQERNRDLTEALEQQTATSEVLGVIAGSPTELQPVLNTVVASAVRLAGAEKGHIYQHDGEFLRVTAFYNETPEEIALLRELPIKPTPGSLNLQAFTEGKSFQRLDAREGDYKGPGRRVGARTVLAVPLLREGTAIGTITIWREVVEAFTERQIDLVKTFADQAVIAIENVRLFNELKRESRAGASNGDGRDASASSPLAHGRSAGAGHVIANAVKLSGATKVMSVKSMASFSGSLPIMARRPKKSPCFRADRDVLEFRLQQIAHSASKKPYRLPMLQQSVARAVLPHGMEAGRCCQYRCCERERPSE